MTDAEILRGPLGTGGETILASVLNCLTSRVGQPRYRTQGWAETAPSVASGAACLGCAEPLENMIATVIAANEAKAAPVRTKPNFFDISPNDRVLSWS